MESIKTVEQLVARFESSTLDYKTNYELTNPDRFVIAGDVAAFSNAFGGAIIVGLQEERGQVVKVVGVSDVAKLTATVSAALLLHCVPVPTTPEECSIVVSPADAARLLKASGAPPPPTEVTLVALNVRADPRGPIGVRRYPKDQSLKGMADLYKFPMRLDDQTRFLDPTELPMWMNSHERRIAIRLRQIPERARVHTFEHGARRTVNFEGVDEDQMIALFSFVGVGRRAHVPLEYVAAAWFDPGAEGWCVEIKGQLFRDETHAFEPVGR